MNYLKLTQYVYLVFGLYFIYLAITQYNSGESAWLSIFISVLAIFMFFFRRRFARKFEENKKNSKQL